ncbi:MAG: alpha/beta fold hydrolase [Myxococcales bacterium]|nr:alpha/beta fold hydrolase [Myxococcales bacterium]
MRTPSHSVGLLVFTLLLSSGSFAGCGSDGDAGVPMTMGAPDVLTGAEPLAGFQLLETTYTVPGTGEQRTLRLNVWYATLDETGTPARFNAISVDRSSLVDASVRVPRGRAPLMIYSHGDGAWGGANYALSRQFVRNGWIVVAPDHPGLIFGDNPDPRPFDSAVVRLYDLQATLDFMADLPSDHPLAGHVDTERVLVAGHSLGGQSAWLAGGPAFDLATIEASCAPSCVQAQLDAYAMYEPDPRVAGIVSLDGGVSTGLVADEGFASMIAPAMLITPPDSASDAALFARSEGADVTWVQLAGACHNSFTGILGCPTLPLTTSLPVTATYTLAFGIRHVLQSDDPTLLAILDGSSEVDPVVTLLHHGP